MQSTRCQHDIPAGEKFCGACGARLVVAYSACSASNPAEQEICGEIGTSLSSASSPATDSYTPKDLAEKILTSQAALEVESNQVTVLFTDLKRSMEPVADRDPEEARTILGPVRVGR